MSRRLIAVVSLQRSLKSRVAAIVNEVYKNVQKPMLFTGIAREYTPKAEDGHKFPAENLAVQLTVEGLLESVTTDLSGLWDLTATRDQGNQMAKADVRINGTVIIPQVSVSNLLFLEKQLIDFRTMLTACPVLDSAKEWITDTDTGISRTPRPIETTKSEKIEDTVIVVPSNERHPAQTRDRTKDVIVGTWATTHFSGALTTHRQHQLVGRVNVLIDAIKVAREEANLITVDDVRVADALFDFILRQ